MQPLTYTFEELVAHKKSGVPTEAAIAKLRADADAILEKPTFKITDVTLPRPSGDIHDFVSMGPYWWPNPDTPDGLPWVNRDGLINPDARTSIDVRNMFLRIRTLALAAFYFEDKKYSDYANRQLYDWYISPETRMNPNAKYGQSVPGVAEGRGAGLIEFSSSFEMFNGIGILDSMGLMDGEILNGVKAWYVDFANWILTHELGIRIDNSVDNHASWHSANLLSIAVFTERPALMKKIMATAYARRVKSYILPDGSQPAELRRTKPLGYSFFNLMAMFVVANIAERNGYAEYWAVDGERGKCILKSAVDFLYPYVKDPDSCPYPDLHRGKHGLSMSKAFSVVAKRYPDEGYEELARELFVENDAWCLAPVL